MYDAINKKNNNNSASKKKVDVSSFGTSKRNVYNEMNSLGPGPGYYSKQAYADMNEWHKKTFNYRYLKQFHTGSGAPGSMADAGHNTVFPWDNSS